MTYGLVLVADSARARFFSIAGPRAPLEPVEDLVCPESRMKERDLVSDRQGRSFDSKGAGRHATEPAKSASDVVAARFASEVAARLETGRLNDEYRRLFIVADPRFLGLVDKALGKSVRNLVCGKLNKDLSKLKPAEIREHLPERI